MITQFDEHDRATWPKEQEPVLILYRLFGVENTAVAYWEEGRYFPDWTVEGVKGYEFDTAFHTQDILAWQPIPSWEKTEADLAKERAIKEGKRLGLTEDIIRLLTK
jgi:hypothetical protein